MFITIFLIFGIVPQSEATDPSTCGSNVKIVHSDGRSIELALTVDDFHTETIEHEGETYQRLIIPDIAQSDRTGEPQVPTCGTLLGVPTHGGLSLQILNASYETLNGYHLYPASEYKIMGDNLDNLTNINMEQRFTINQKIYTKNTFYPGRTAEIDHTGFMRNQPVVQVQFYPVQYNPTTGELRLYRYIHAKITWDAALAEKTQPTLKTNTEYENLLKNTLMNYDFLGRPPGSNHTRPGTNTSNENINTSDSSITLKIGVTEDGMYRLAYTDLSNAGVDMASLDPRKIKLVNQGIEVPLYVKGENDGVFDASDYILFYGTAITDRYTSKNVYWLTIGETNGRRMDTKDGTPSGTATVPAQFPTTLHAEEGTYYWQNLPNGKGKDHWYWGDKLTAPESRDYSLILNNISTETGTASVHVRLQGRSILPNSSPDHHTRIYLNNIIIDDKKWDSQIVYDHEVTIPHSYLNEGANIIRAEVVNDIGAPIDQVLVNWIEIDYFDTFKAENDKLVFGAPTAGAFQFDITGFGSNDIDIFDITDPANVVRINNAMVFSGNSAYTLRFEDTAKQGTHYLALTSSQHKTPATIEKDQPSFWKSPNNQADYIIITYVLLVGDATQDYKDNLKTGMINYVPAQLIENTMTGETPSDNWYVLTSGDDILPDMFIGRLCAQTKSQVDDIVAKIIFYDKNPPDKSWNKDMLLVADDDEATFEETSNLLVGILPGNYTANKVYISQYTSSADITTDIINYINTGNVLANYAGHGSVTTWGQGNDDKIFFTTSKIASLNNRI